ncbi:MAG TPA: cytochrome c3 family protein [Pyrinomonadaceae bacterium]|nr:cytochrome c3 family protein [Pyrinomonadaceae bacterium]
MKKLLVLLVLLGCVAIGVVANHSSLSASQDIPKESKVQPKEVVLGKDSQSDKYGEVPFNHENHSIKNYSIDGKAVIACVDCHHTDQPASGLKAPLKTGERDAVLTAALLQAADAKPVKSCRTCHLQAGDDSAPMPTITYADKPAPVKVNNEVAYHTNCNLCHDKAIAARPVLKGKIPGSNDCLPCHKPAS